MAGQMTLGSLTWSVTVLAGLWIGLCVAGAAGLHLSARLRICLDCHYGWKDAGILLRKRRKRALHALIEADRQPLPAQGPVRPVAIGYAPTVTMEAAAVDSDGSPAG